MSGGHFNYAFVSTGRFSTDLELELATAGMKDRSGEYKPELPYRVAHELREIAALADYTSRLMREAEWYFSGDTGNDTFLSRVADIKKDNHYWQAED